jgi:hypothetical protein
VFSVATDKLIHPITIFAVVDPLNNDCVPIDPAPAIVDNIITGSDK